MILDLISHFIVVLEEIYTMEPLMVTQTLCIGNILINELSSFPIDYKFLFGKVLLFRCPNYAQSILSLISKRSTSICPAHYKYLLTVSQLQPVEFENRIGWTLLSGIQ